MEKCLQSDLFLQKDVVKYAPRSDNKMKIYVYLDESRLNS